MEDAGNGIYRYHPTPDYYGQDRATFLVEIGDLKVKVMYFFKVQFGGFGGTEGYDPYGDKKNCPNGHYWRISLNPDDPNAPLYTFEHSYQLTSALAGVVNANLTFADLSGDALGQTFGNTITLDIGAAGHGWFLDTTPWDNSEYVATSNPNEWVALPGSEASGKMDLLSVLLHEYGHVLGLDHSDNAHSLMSEDLRPGVRHTVSVEDMQALWSVLGDSIPTDTTSPGSPFNPLPLSSSLLFGFTRLRRGVFILPILSPAVDRHPAKISRQALFDFTISLYTVHVPRRTLPAAASRGQHRGDQGTQEKNPAGQHPDRAGRS